MCEQFKLHAGLVPAHLPKPSVSRVLVNGLVLHHGCCGWVVLGYRLRGEGNFATGPCWVLWGTCAAHGFPSSVGPSCVLPRPMWGQWSSFNEVPPPQPAANTGP